jgi:hypothetical protein
MPIEDTDIPTIDNKADFLIDNQVERFYIYKATRTSTVSITPSVDNLRFYKLPEKYNGFNVFLSENGVYYIWGILLGGNTGYWVLSQQKGLIGSGIPTTQIDNSFLINLPSPENTFSVYISPIGTVTIVISKITSNE